MLLLCSPDKFRGDAATNFSILQRTQVPIIDLTPQRAGASPPPSLTSPDLSRKLTDHCHDAAWLIDALLGTGAQGNPRPPFDTAIECINARPAKTRALAIDVPSGLDCDTGQPSTHTVRADNTCTFAAMKFGFEQPAAKPFTGEVQVCDIGVPPQLIDKVLIQRR